jgi:DNA primase
MSDNKHSILPILEHYGAENPVETLGWKKIRCPFHGDSHASATYNTDINAFKCFACDMAGDTYAIIMKKEGVEFREAYTIAENISGRINKDVSKFNSSGSRVSKSTRNLGAGRKYVPPRSGKRPSHWA